MDYRKIIIVGETNIGRSFMAECILRGILQKRNCQNIEVVSRGLVVLFSEPVAPGAAKILREKGTMNGMITVNENYDLDEIIPRLKAYTTGKVVEKVTCLSLIHISEPTRH